MSGSIAVGSNVRDNTCSTDHSELCGDTVTDDSGRPGPLGGGHTMSHSVVSDLCACKVPALGHSHGADDLSSYSNGNRSRNHALGSRCSSDTGDTVLSTVLCLSPA